MVRFKFVLAVIVLFTGLLLAETPSIDSPNLMVRVGTFDSRAIAIAYYSSEAHDDYVENLIAERKKAKEAGDEERAKELEKEGGTSQELAHKQGFSTYPVDDILEKIKDKIPEIAKKAGVDVIVSKWNLTFQRKGIKFIDVTEALVKCFNPDFDMLEMLKEIEKQPPVSLKEMEKHKD